MTKETEQPMGRAEALLTSVPFVRGPIVRRGIENILKNTIIEYPPQYEEEVISLGQDGCAFEIVANHTSHADAFPAARIGFELASKVNPHLSFEDQIKGFLMPFALSMDKGTQGKLLTILFNDTKPTLNKLGTEPVFTATDNDLANDRVERANPVNFTRLMLKGVRDGKGIIIFPEGKVEGGRRDEQGGLKGMQRFRKDSLQQSLRMSTFDKTKVAVIPAGISGGYNIYDPHKISLPKDTFLVGLGRSSKSLFSVRVGMPIVFERQEVREMSSVEIDQRIGSLIAALLPPQERGVYA